MIEDKKGNLHLFIERAGLVGDVAVCLCFETKASACCLCKLSNAPSCGCFPEGSEEACLCYAIYLLVKQVLCGDPLATSKSKVGAVDCGLHNGKFFITWKIKGTTSAVRKSLGLALKCLAPSKLYNTYAQCVKLCGGRPSKETFAYAVSEINRSLSQMVHCGVIGNIRIEKQDPKSKKVSPAIDMKSMLDTLSKKLVISSPSGNKQKPSNHTSCDHSQYVELKTTGWGSFVVKEYLAAKVKGLTVMHCDKGLLLHIPHNKYSAMSDKLKKNVKDYVEQRYKKVGDQLPAIMGYMMLSSAEVCCDDVHRMIKSGVKYTDVEKQISNSL